MDNRRLLLVFIFCFSLVMLWDAWQKKNHPPAAALPAADLSIPVPQAKPAGTVAAAATPAAIPTSVAEKGDIVKVKTDLFVAEISALGGDVVGLELGNYKATEDKSKNFSLFDKAHRYAAQSGLIGEGLPNHKTLYKVVGGQRELVAGNDKVQLRLEAPMVDGVKVTKVFTFTPGSYLMNVAYEIDNGSQKEFVAHAYYQLQRDTVKPAGESRMVSTFTGPAVYTERDKFQKITFDDIAEGKAKFNDKADNGWMAMVQHYFVSAWIPQETVEREFYVRKLDANANAPITAGVIVPVKSVAPGAKLTHEVSLYAGPQIQSMLEQLAKPAAEGGVGAEGLPLVVDYGMLTIIAAPIFWCLQAIHKLVGNWGWAIVLLTVGIKAIFFPLSAASYKSMARMRALGPRLQALKERCGDDRQKLNVEMMNLYKTEKINPLGGCLPILVQIPVFIALYWALLGAVEMRDAPWILWIKDLSSMDPYYVLPVIMVVTMLVQTKLNPTPPDPIQAKVTMFMPFIFGAMFFFFPSGLVLYWVVNNLLSIGQQWQITRMIDAGGADKGNGAKGGKGGRSAANDAKA
ncbi:membrane protein insertase YidC [Propionivibrio limicola]|uniref:membrane protein insertase YidC n=1 Tax=Propionivibrio limicola TaxID=167645 RepID=UPI001290EACC|nr:membrane protein insertase YidC [Propionivibrio limicola]